MFFCFSRSKALEHCHSEKYRNDSYIKSSLLVSQIWQAQVLVCQGFFMLFFWGVGGWQGGLCLLVLFNLIFFLLQVKKDRFFLMKRDNYAIVLKQLLMTRLCKVLGFRFRYFRFSQGNTQYLAYVLSQSIQISNFRSILSC